MTFSTSQSRLVVTLAFSRGPFNAVKSPLTSSRCQLVGTGVEELRIHTENAYRIFDITKFEEAVYVLHDFQKKTQKTSKQDIQTGQQCYKQLPQYRREQQERQSDA